jgi:DNA polymerase
MGVEPVQDWRKALAGALLWWEDAGLDTFVEDMPRDWLARPAPATALETTPAVVAAPVEILPDTAEAFVAWRMGDAAPEADWMTPRLAPAIVAGADWAVLTDMPESDDGETLLSGAAGRLLDRMLAAIGLSRESVQIVPLAYARPLTGRIPPEQEPRLAMLARHHLGLVAPKKLLILGQAASRAMDGTNFWPPDNSLHDVNQFGGNTEVAATFHPRWLLDHLAAKRETWKHLLLLSRGARV